MLKVKLYRWIKVHFFGHQSFIKKNAVGGNTYVLIKGESKFPNFANTFLSFDLKEEWPRVEKEN